METEFSLTIRGKKYPIVVSQEDENHIKIILPKDISGKECPDISLYLCDFNFHKRQDPVHDAYDVDKETEVGIELNVDSEADGNFAYPIDEYPDPELIVKD